MSKSSARSEIRLRGLRHNNLKNFDLDLPLNQLIVITGLSGSGKSSLAFDTLFAEGQRRYIETFSPYARQFFDRMDKPQVDSIEGIPPAIAIEQRNSVRTTRSTVGTMTEICDYMRMLWPHVAQLHCRNCGQPVRKDSPQSIWNGLQKGTWTELTNGAGDSELLVTFDLPLSEKLSLEESLNLVAKQGYQRLLLNNRIIRLEECLSSTLPTNHLASLTVVQDRLRPSTANRARFVEACEQAYHFGKGKLGLHRLVRGQSSISKPHCFSNRLHCVKCDLEYREASPALFSFNNPLGACPACRGFGRVITIDYDLALPDRSKTLAQGAVKPWQSGQSADCQTDLLKMCRHFGIPVNVPFAELPRKWQDFVIEGDPDYGKDEEHEWPRAWYGIKGYFRWLESKTYKMHVRVLLSRYRAYTPCPTCGGKRFQPESLLYRIPSSVQGSTEWLTLADFYQLPIRDALTFIKSLGEKYQTKRNDPFGLVLNEVRSRLGYLEEVGLGYLTLDRPTRSLSGGETERVSLTTCLGTRLVNTLFVLDEPSVGLHPRDTERLVRILHQLRDTGNTVVVVEHEPGIMRAANQIVDLGPGHGADGGALVFQGTYKEILKSKASLTGQYLSARKEIEIPMRRPVNLTEPRENSRSPSTTNYAYRQDSLGPLALNDAPRSLEDRTLTPSLKIHSAALHNLKNLSVEFPLNRLVCVTGVSGSGKTTLVREILLPQLTAQLNNDSPTLKASSRMDVEPNGENENEEWTNDSSGDHGARLEGAEQLRRVLLVDQSILGKTPRSNPALYVGAFDWIRDFFAQSEPARERNYGPGIFSFNSRDGQCERCRGAGFEKIEMQFLSDVFIRCPDCNGRRYRSVVLEVKVGIPGQRAMSIADLLDSSVEEVIAFLSNYPESRPARRALQSLRLLEEVGLGYLKLGQPINTLSGGESQRLKLVRHLAEAVGNPGDGRIHSRQETPPQNPSSPLPTLFLFDEPTTGLHFDDVRALLKVFQRLVDAGNSVIIIEHNLEVIKCADWIIDLGPEAGDHGGEVIAEGPPEEIASCHSSHTGVALRDVLKNAPGKLKRSSRDLVKPQRL